MSAGIRDGRQHEYFRTTCGRKLTVGRLALGDTQHPAARVFIDLGACPGCDTTAWAGLTVDEARHLAQAVLSQAAEAEKDVSSLKVVRRLAGRGAKPDGGATPRRASTARARHDQDRCAYDLGWRP
jgi:hypothetical protein